MQVVLVRSKALFLSLHFFLDRNSVTERKKNCLFNNFSIQMFRLAFQSETDGATGCCLPREIRKTSAEKKQESRTNVCDFPDLENRGPCSNRLLAARWKDFT